MFNTGNKKALSYLAGFKGLLGCQYKGILTMNNISQISNITTLINNEVEKLPLEVLEADIGGMQQFVVNARPLHAFLKVGRDFTTWIKQRISKYKFVENEDFRVFTDSGENLLGGRPSTEYLITLDVAKELCMVENNHKGREARRYFIHCEKLAFEAIKEKLVQPDTKSYYTSEQQYSDKPYNIRDFVNRTRYDVMNYVWTLQNQVVNLGGTPLPMPFDSEKMAQGFVGHFLDGKRMMMNFSGDQVHLQFVAHNSMTIDVDEMADMIAKRETMPRQVLADIADAALKRLAKQPKHF